MNKSFLLFLTLATGLLACEPQINYCDLSEVKTELKNTMIADMKGWQKNANYAGIEEFEEKVNRVIANLEVADNWYEGSNDYKVSQMYLEQNEEGASSCICGTKIRFRNHEEYKKSIEGPVAKVKAEEHPTNSAYLRLEEQMNYLDNDGFVFSYVVIKKENQPVKVIQFYPILTQTNVDDAGGLLYDYVGFQEEN